MTARIRHRLLATFILAGTMVAAGTAEPPPAAPWLDVMTFNIRTAYGRDGENAWPNRKELVAGTIQRRLPHLVGLQEVVGEQIEYLEEVLPDYRWLGVDRGLNGGEGLSEYTPIFYRHGELVPIESGNFWLSPTPDTPPEFREIRGRRRRFGRIVTWARFHHLATGRRVYAYNTHFTIRRGERQLESANLIADRVASLPEQSVVIVTGDFNAPAGASETWRAATATGLLDAWVVADERQGPEFTLSEFGPPVDWNVGRIDWILVGGPISVRSAETILDNEAGRYPSDHYPVTARLVLE
jgi:endonuclease/exonuclease/phosphatase family metal-dependent hydrolase